MRAMAPLIVGRDVFQIRHLGQVLLDDFAIRRSSVDLLCALSALEIASWDIVGKRAGLPVYNLLGGAVRERIRVYANGWWFGAKGIDDTVARAVKVVEQGYTAIKWDPIPGPWRTYVAASDEDEAVAMANGTEFGLAVNKRHERPPFIAYLGNITELRRIDETAADCEALHATTARPYIRAARMAPGFT